MNYEPKTIRARDLVDGQEYLTQYGKIQYILHYSEGDKGVEFTLGKHDYFVGLDYEIEILVPIEEKVLDHEA